MMEPGLFKHSLTGIVGAAVLILGSFTGAAPAEAALCEFGTEAEFKLSADVWTSTACVGELPGNDSPDNGNGANVNLNDPTNFGGDPLFGSIEWSLDSRYDAEDGFDAPGGVTGRLSIDDVSDDLFMGNWSVTNWDGVGQAMLVLKGGDSFAAYLLNILAGTNGQWSTQALEVGQNFNQPEISHVSLYTTPAPIPLPAAGFLLIGALGGLGLAARRRRRGA